MEKSHMEDARDVPVLAPPAPSSFGDTLATILDGYWKLFGALLTGGTLVFALFLRHLQLPPALGPTSPLLGGAFVVFALAMTWINDSLAYFIGMRWGRRRLLPAISPKKTVEGALAGFIGASLIGGVLGAAVFQGYFGLPFGPFLGAGAGASIAGAAQLGDLAESHIKRAAGVKDSGGLLPGHGGLLDRCDALFFSLPVAYWYFALVLGLAGGAQWQ